MDILIKTRSIYSKILFFWDTLYDMDQSIFGTKSKSIQLDKCINGLGFNRKVFIRVGHREGFMIYMKIL